MSETLREIRWTNGVYCTPRFQQLLRVSYRVEQISIQTLSAQCVDEILDMWVLPRTARCDENGVAFTFRKPLPDLLGDKLGSIVASDMLRNTAYQTQPVQNLDNVARRDGALWE